MKKIISLILIISFVFGLLAAQVGAYAYIGKKWDKYYLKIYYSSNTLNTTHPNSGVRYADIFGDSFYRWSVALNGKFTFAAVQTSDYDIYLHVYNWGNTGWDGQANVHGNPIYMADAKLNRYYTDSYTYEKARGVAVHEIGHDLGLADIVYPSAVMHWRTSDRIPTVPASDDINGVKNLYGF